MNYVESLQILILIALSAFMFLEHMRARRNNFVYETRTKMLFDYPYEYYKILPSYNEMLKIKHWDRWTFDKWLIYAEEAHGIFRAEVKVLEVN